ncbi:MAG: cadherin repeat domain-containing protein [Verrucomicrobia bacterium]|nr:cadherin repeat domain-containing protein [Verrucomicrobiota bacterium]
MRGDTFVNKPAYSQPITCQCDPGSYVPFCLNMSAAETVLGAAAKAVTAAISTIPNFKASAKVEASAKLCTCCDKDGLGMKVDASAGMKINAGFSIPLVGNKVTGSYSENGYEVKYDFALGCFFEPSFSASGTIQGKTDCHFKNPQACAEASVNADLAVVCRVGGTVSFEQDGVEMGKQGAELYVTIKSGVSGSVKYCIGQGLTGQICAKSVTLEGGAKVKFGNFGYDIVLKQDLTPSFCYPSSPKKAEWDEIALRADAEILAAADKLSRTLPQMNFAQTYVPATPLLVTAPTPKSKLGLADTTEESGICAKVKLRLDQDLILTRNAFNATLELDNLSAASGLENVQVLINITDKNGQPANEVFGIRDPVVAGLTAVDGTGALGAASSGSATWILVPTRAAAPDGPVDYGVGGVLIYQQDGHEITIPLFSAPITVYPDPALSVQYFHQRDVFSDDPFTPEVEPSVPFVLGVVVDNHGKGTAKNVRIISGQPRIVENQKGLLIDFKIIGSQVNHQPQTPSLTANFGEIAPGQRGVGLWYLTSTLQGQFEDYKATFEHLDSLGKTNLSLIDEVTIHEMIHLVQAPGPFEDGLPDFLVNDIGDPENLPDTLYFSDRTTQPVQVARDASWDGPVNSGRLAVQMTATMPSGWCYLLVDDPGDGDFILRQVVRSDGVEIAMNTNVWTTDRTFIGGGRRPRLEHVLHLLDFNSTGKYTLYYEPAPAPDREAPTSRVAALAAHSYPQFSVRWSGQDNAGGSGLASYTIYVSADGAPFAPWLAGTTLSGAVYQGQPGRTYAFYSLATDAQGNQEKAPSQPQAQTTVDRLNAPPVIAAVTNVVINEGQTLVLTLTAADADPEDSLTYRLEGPAPSGMVLNPATGRLTWPTGESDGPGTNRVRVVVADNGQPSLSSTGIVAIVVNEVNTPPSLGAAATRTIREEQTLTVVFKAADADLPPQALSFSLGVNAPAGAKISPTTGVFSWRPNSSQGPSTNRIEVRVSDDGVPSMSATQTLTVIVRDTSPFSFAVGSTNVFAGETNSVPLLFSSSLDLALKTVDFVLDVPADRLAGLAIQDAAAGEVLSSVLSPAGGNSSALRFTLDPSQIGSGLHPIASLKFHAVSNAHSTVATLQMQNLVGTRSDGAAITTGGRKDGAVIVVGDEPVLSMDPQPQLVIYGRPGQTYIIQYTTELTENPAWKEWTRKTQVDRIMTVSDLVQGAGSVFYRVVQP